jgi:hypothetical protein
VNWEIRHRGSDLGPQIQSSAISTSAGVHVVLGHRVVLGYGIPTPPSLRQIFGGFQPNLVGLAKGNPRLSSGRNR